MGRIQQNLGNGYFGDVELDLFTKLLTGQIDITDEIRKDTPQAFNDTFEFIGLSFSGAPTSENLWGISRISWSNNRPIRFQFLGGVAWDNRTSLPWPA